MKLVLILLFFSIVVICVNYTNAQDPVENEGITTKRSKSRTTTPTTPKPKHKEKHQIIVEPASEPGSQIEPPNTEQKQKLEDLKSKNESVESKKEKPKVKSATSPEKVKGKVIVESVEPPKDEGKKRQPDSKTANDTVRSEDETIDKGKGSKKEAPKTTEGRSVVNTTINANKVDEGSTVPSNTTKGKAEKKKPPKSIEGRSAIPITETSSTVDVRSNDPFSLSPNWALFNRRMDNLTIILIEKMKPIYSIFTEKNEEYKINKTGFLDTFLINFNVKYVKSLVELLQPVDDELTRNEAFTVINPAIGLRTIIDAVEFAKTNPSSDLDKGRLKWMEINSMAGTIHYIFKRLFTKIEFLNDLENVKTTMTIPYPSWVTERVTKDNESSFQDLTATNLTAYIHDQMNILGESNHLIRILERLLNKSVLNNWNPDSNSLNMYCYGNNRNGHIYKKFDVLLDAALYLCLADMKFAIIDMTNYVYLAWKAEMENGVKFDLEGMRSGIESTLKTRLERKYRISTEYGNKDIETTIAPQRFKCDKPPSSCGEPPRQTAPNCPIGIYIQDGTVFNNGSKLPLPNDINGTISLDGKPVECIGLELVPYDQNGTITPCYLKEGKCVDSNTDKVMEEFKVVLTPVLIDGNRVPLRRSIQLPVYPNSSEWGILDCGIHPDPPVLDLPQGEFMSNQTGGDLSSAPRMTYGYEDTRKPNITDSAQFSNAFPGYLESELVLNPDGKCIGTCRNYRRTTPTCINKTTHCDLYRKSHCDDSVDCLKTSKCLSNARRCIRTSPKVSFCPAKEGSGRLYDWLKFNDKIRRAGIADDVNNNSSAEVNPECTGNQIMKLQERWEMESGVILKMPEYCELCLCICNDPISPDGQHHFDISSRMADSANGYVVTGFRFEQTNRTMILNIQHGKLMDNGKIDTSTLKWLEPSGSPQLSQLGTGGFSKINLDEIVAKFTEVIMGIRWSQTGNVLNLEAAVTEYISKVPSATSNIYFIGAKTQSGIRQKYNLTEVNTPLRQGGPSQPYPITEESKYYIEFDASSLEKDSGQSVVPFFDLQPIVSSDTVPIPLSAVGILYKSKQGSGGFLAPSIRTFVHPYMREIL